jgi:UDP-glucose 4-epimerase
MAKVLVVGGAGYIGSHAVLALRDAGSSVVVFDNCSRGHSLLVPPEVLLLRGDIRDRVALDECFSMHEIDVVMHFAALAYVGESVRDPERYYDNNVSGTLNLLSSMLRHGVCRIVFSSSCATYGLAAQIPITEGQLQMPVNPYGHTKLMIEQALKDYAGAYGLQSISLRYFNAAGADSRCRSGEVHDPETHLIPLVLAEAMRVMEGGDPNHTSLEVFGNDFPTPDGSCVRDYIHVTDLGAAHLLAAERLVHGDVLGAEFFNLANGLGFSVLDVIRTCSAVTGQEISFKVAGRRAGDPAILVGDASKAKSLLMWYPRYTELTCIIESAWRWMRKNQGSAGFLPASGFVLPR